MATSQPQCSQVVKMSTRSLLGCIMQCEHEKDQYCIRVLTPCFDEYRYVTLSSTEFHPILRIETQSTIHQHGLLSLISVPSFTVLFEEPILIPFAPRIHNDADKTITSKILKWWKEITQHANQEKLNVFMQLSHHSTGPIVAHIDAFLSQNHSVLMHAFKNDKNELDQLRKALLIDGANTFDEGAYELICRINHSCDPNCFVSTDGKVKALRDIQPNDELVWNFLNDKYLYSCTATRTQRLYAIWGFKCNCLRCNQLFDDARIFKCIKCSKPSIYVSYDRECKEDEDDVFAPIICFGDCAECKYKLQSHEIEYYLAMEDKVDQMIESMEQIETELEETVQHVGLYLSDRHFKWFELWNAMRVQLNDKERTLKYVLVKCYEAMTRIYGKSMNYCLYEIEWRLLNCIIHDADEQALIHTLYTSIEQAKDTFIEMDPEQWKQISEAVKDLK